MREEIFPAVYILASGRNGTLYIGVTGNLCARVARHKNRDVAGFTKSHDVKLLVWLQNFPTMEDAIKREKQLKEWRRQWKVNLIEATNPLWLDLYAEICGKYIE